MTLSSGYGCRYPLVPDLARGVPRHPRWAGVRAGGVLLLASLSLSAATARAQDVSIVDVDARVNSVGRPVELRLDQGAYSIVPIGIGQGGQFEGWSSWSETTCSAIAGCPRTFPTTAKGFLGDYRVRSAAIGRVFVDGLELEAVREDDGLASAFVRLEDDDDREDDDRDDDDRDDDGRDDDDEREDEAYIRVSNMMVYPDDMLALANAPVTIFRAARHSRLRDHRLSGRR